MIENLSIPRAWLLVVALAGCTRAGADAPAALQGVVEFDDRALGFELGGRVATVAVERGQTVTPGQVIATLDEGLARPARAAREAEVAAARAQLRLLQAGARREDVRGVEAQLTAARATETAVQRNLTRARGLAAQGAVPTAGLDDLEAQRARAMGERGALEERLAALRSGARTQEVSAARARLEAAESVLAAEDARLARHTLRAQLGGVVLERHVEAGEVAGAGVPVVTVADTTHPYVEVFVPQAGLAAVALGAPATVRIDGERAGLAGRVEFIGRRLEYTPRFLFSPRERPNLVARVRVRIDDPTGRLHAGVPATVELGHGR
ncbi:MAG: HlyD family efflux transporter periplasmic adaptor subunit [Deltaproteobacteria bacterium]|nr:HlyD family efflux transporter periplasmic adaptor subunit [Deltaproteobacteria bacterium]MBP6830072.1 HlyD family efflux transporter periplasmic adaptor subunit [Deltaproteobacteria bacterium]